MSLYNMVKGVSDVLVVISCIVGYRIDKEIPRFRDVFLADEESDADYLIYTRMGGGNYECWEDGEDECSCPFHRLLEFEKSDCYLGGYDDEFDFTYRTLEFKFTQEQKYKYDEVVSNGIDVIKEELKNMFPEIYADLFEKELKDENRTD